MSIAETRKQKFQRHSATAKPTTTEPRHPLGRKAKILLSSVFGPYARDDEYGSRAMNPMELWHNQVTRVQGAFSLRMFHRSWGLMLIQANIETRCTCLDFPSLDRFIEEIRDNDYDIVGVSGIVPNLLKVKKMCELIRQHLPKATIVIGGHIVNLPDLPELIDADHFVRGDGVRWFRRFLGEDVSAPIAHPLVLSAFDRRAMGMKISFAPNTDSATLIPSVGCPLGCNFCATSAMFGGKGKSVDFYPKARDLFEIMCQLEEKMHLRSFFVLDENFLLKRDRALGLLELMQTHNKPWALYVFSSANALSKYTMEELVALGVSWLWLGLEGKDSQYSKLNSTDTRDLVRRLRENGIRVLGSTIIGMEDHTPENIDDVIDLAVSHDVDFHQFMLYTPVAGTPLYAQHAQAGTLMGPDEIPFSDTHGQFRFNFRHPHIRNGRETEYLLRAFTKDFQINGPSVLRVVRTTINGWRKYRNHRDPRIRNRIKWETGGIATTFSASLWAGRKWFKDNPPVAKLIDAMLQDVYKEFGIVARLAGPTVGRYIYRKIKQENARLASGLTYEPPTFYQRNYVETKASAPKATLIESVTASSQHISAVNK